MSRCLLCLALIGLSAGLGFGRDLSPTVPEVRVLADPELSDAAEDIDRIVRGDLSEVLTLTGAEDLGGAITIVLMPEGSPLANETPSWVAGYARGDRRTIVVFPERVPSYPDRNLDQLVRHEIAHLLIWQVSGGRSIPRWLHEGIATVAAREWGMEDQARYAVSAFGAGPSSLVQLDRAFRGPGPEVRRAYALSAAFVRFLRSEYGPDLPGRLLSGIGSGQTVGAAFRSVTGRSLAQAEHRFFKEQRFWNLWVPFLTSPVALWMGVTLLALVAILQRHRRNRELHRRWDEEEPEISDPVN